MNLIEVVNVSKTFRRASRQLLRERLWNLLSPKQDAGFQVLRNVNFKVAEGEGVAIVGANGAGKSTLLGIVAGLALPDTGTVTVHGRIAPLLELGSGFHPDLTGVENVTLNAALLGFNEQQVRENLDSIVEYAEIGEFIHEPIRTYSSGMVVRLAFAVAIHVDPSILIVDEVLGVGDSHFQQKCRGSIANLRRAGKTLLCVSHSGAMVLDYCDRAIWLDHGQIVMDGDAASVLKEYTAYSANPELYPALHACQ
jgi:ABC-type polysaccharide/polyol phosphate transport system ATPase subunit